MDDSEHDVLAYITFPAQHRTKLEQNDEWLLQCRYMQIEGMAKLTPPLIDADPAKLTPPAA